MLAAAAAAKSLQSCLTLCDPTDSSPPGSPVPGILQARTVEWAAISFSNAWVWKAKVKLLSRVPLFTTPWTAAYQAPLSMGFSRQKYWSGVPLPFPRECLLCSKYIFFPGLTHRMLITTPGIYRWGLWGAGSRGACATHFHKYVSRNEKTDGTNNQITNKIASTKMKWNIAKCACVIWAIFTKKKKSFWKCLPLSYKAFWGLAL